MESLRLRWVLTRKRLILPRNLDQDLIKSETENLALINLNRSQSLETMESNREAYQAQIVLTKVTPRAKATPSQKAEAIQEVTEISPESTKEERVQLWDLRNHQEVHNS